ncbi:MAG: hypothetical protein QM750_09265 [Rubrivivax sp.]
MDPLDHSPPTHDDTDDADDADAVHDDGGAHGPFEHVDAAGHHIWGTPEHDRRFHHDQEVDGICAIAAQDSILECLTGHRPHPVESAIYNAQNGWVRMGEDAGMQPTDIGKWLEMNRIPCHSNDDATFLDVVRELAAGNKVIAAVDSSALWSGADSLHAFSSQAKDHAIWLTGVDDTDPEHIKVIINDSGRPDGAGNVYDLHELRDVLDTHGIRYVATGHGPNLVPDHAIGYDETHHVFPALEQFLSEHKTQIAIAGVAAAAAAGAAALRKAPRGEDGAWEIVPDAPRETAFGAPAPTAALPLARETGAPNAAHASRLPPPSIAPAPQGSDREAQDRRFHEL